MSIVFTVLFKNYEDDLHNMLDYDPRGLDYWDNFRRLLYSIVVITMIGLILNAVELGRTIY